MNGAVIETVEVGAAHDGVAELIVTLHFANGGRSLVTLDAIAAGALMRACNVTDPAGLSGQGWEKVRDALGVSWNRFLNPPHTET